MVTTSRAPRAPWWVLISIVACLAGLGAAPAPIVEVGWISREPRLRAPESLNGPRADGWPAEGSAVQWIGHVLNRSTEVVEDVPYTWRIDGRVEREGLVDLLPGDNELVLPWRWTINRHAIELAIAPPDSHRHARAHDRLRIDSDALSIAYYVDASLYASLIGSRYGSFEYQSQEQIPYWNSVLADAIYPSAPQGALDRIRLDKVAIVPDGVPMSDEDYYDSDLFWRFLSSWGSYFDGRDQTILLHEMLHQRGLVDNYAYEVAHYFNPNPIEGGRTNVLESGRAIVNTPVLPAIPDTRNIGGIFLFKTPPQVEGLMGHTYYRGSAVLTEVCVNGLNLWHHRRTPVSRWPTPSRGIALPMKLMTAESYVNRLPKTTALTLVADGQEVRNASVDVFLDQNGMPYRDTYSEQPQLALEIDADGVAMLPGNLLEGQPPWAQPAKAQTMLLRVRTATARAYVFVPVWEFNRLYFRHAGGSAGLQIPVRMIPY